MSATRIATNSKTVEQNPAIALLLVSLVAAVLAVLLNHFGIISLSLGTTIFCLVVVHCISLALIVGMVRKMVKR